MNKYKIRYKNKRILVTLDDKPLIAFGKQKSKEEDFLYWTKDNLITGNVFIVNKSLRKKYNKIKNKNTNTNRNNRYSPLDRTKCTCSGCMFLKTHELAGAIPTLDESSLF